MAACASWFTGGCSVYDASLLDVCGKGPQSTCAEPTTVSGPATSGTGTTGSQSVVGAGGGPADSGRDAGGGPTGTGVGGASGSSSVGAGGASEAGVDASSSGGSAGAAIDAAAHDATPEVFCPGAGTAVSFDRTKSQQVVIPAAAMPTGSTPRTIEMWVLNASPISNWAPNHTVWELGGGSSLATFAMDFDDVGSPSRMELYTNPSSNSFFFDTGVMQDTWFHLAGTYDGTKTHAYVNGIEIGKGFVLSGPLSTPTNQPLYVGSGAFGEYFTGSIDEVRVWNIARTQAEIARDMNYQLAGNEIGLVGYYPFDEGSGLVAKDETTRNNHGKLINGVTYRPSGVPLRCR